MRKVVDVFAHYKFTSSINWQLSIFPGMSLGKILIYHILWESV